LQLNISLYDFLFSNSFRYCALLIVQLTLGTDAEEIVAVADYPVACSLSDFLRKVNQLGNIDICDIATLGADKMWVGEWITTVVMATGVGKAELDQLSHFLEDSYRFVDGGQAGHGKINLHPVIYLLGG
jgi:hypothetical protein